MNVFCEAAWLRFWDALVADNQLQKIRLFKNNHTPVFTDTVADYTEANFSGYVGPTSVVWGAAFVNGANQGEIDAAELTWTHSGGGTANTVYGIYVTDSAGNLCYAERFDAPVSMGSAGDKIRYTPIATLIDQ